MVTNEIEKFAKKHEGRFLHHVKVETIQLLDNSELVRRLKKTFWAGVVIIKSRGQEKCTIYTISVWQKQGTVLVQ